MLCHELRKQGPGSLLIPALKRCPDRGHIKPLCFKTVEPGQETGIIRIPGGHLTFPAEQLLQQGKDGVDITVLEGLPWSAHIDPFGFQGIKTG